MTAVEIIMTVGGISSALMATIGFIAMIAGKSKSGKNKIKNYVKESFGLNAITEDIAGIREKLLEHLKCDDANILESRKQSSALLSLLRKDLKHMCEDAVNQGYVTFKEREMISASYKAYTDLNGNSFICGVVEKILDLPIHQDDD